MRIISFLPTTLPDISLADFAGYDPATSKIILRDSRIQFSHRLGRKQTVGLAQNQLSDWPLLAKADTRFYF